MQAYIYVLHFNVPLCHALHYVGVTENLRARLTCHAKGHGSRLTRELMLKGIPWQLASVYLTFSSEMRRVERRMKEQHHSSRYCSICQTQPHGFPRCQTLDLSLINFPRDSETLSTYARPSILSVRSVTQQTAQQAHDIAIDLGRSHKEELGFIPAGGPEGLTTLINKGQIALATDNDVPVGFAAYTLTESVQIHQLAVLDAHRLCGHGTRMIRQIEAKHPKKILQAKVRADLAANEFWKLSGFALASTEAHKTSKHMINLWRKLP